MSGGPGPLQPPVVPGVSTAEEEPALETAEDPLLEGFDRPLTVLMVGASGFVGRHLLERLVSRGHRVRAVARSGRPEGSRVLGDQVQWVAADITDPDDVDGLSRDCDVLVHLAGIRREGPGQSFRGVHVEGTRHLLEEAARCGTGRFVHVSALGASPRGAPFFRTKFEAEQAVRASDLDWVIARPSAVYGPDDHFVSPTARWLQAFPVFPVPSGDRIVVRPAAIEDVADALCQSVERDEMANKTYLLTGPDRLGLAEAVRTVASVLGLRRWVLPVPQAAANTFFRAADRMGLPALPVIEGWALLARRPDVRIRMNHFRSAFNIEPLPFRVALEDYL